MKVNYKANKARHIRDLALKAIKEKQERSANHIAEFYK